MPRTKQPRRTRSIRETTEESDSLVRDFEQQAAQRIHKVEADLSMQMRMLVNSMDVMLASLPTDLTKLTIGEILKLDIDQEHDATMETTDESSEISSVSKTAGRPKNAPKRTTAASDDGYATESTTTARTTHISRINNTKNSTRHELRKHRSSSNNSASQKRPTRTTRSASRNRNSQFNKEQENRSDLLKMPSGCPSSAKYKTPSMKNQTPFFNVVTPKIKPNTPMNIMRRPRQGEMVLSMQGSPLLISSIVQERTANINVPLRNGDVISLLPNPGLRLSHMPAVDDETMQQLKTLNSHLSKVMANK